FANRPFRMALRSHRAHLYRIRCAISQLRCQRPLPASGAESQVEKARRHSLAASRARDDRRDRLPLLASRLSLHDPWPARRNRRSPDHVREGRLPRSQDFAVGPDVGGLHDHALHPLELRLARAPGRHHGNSRFRGCAGCVGSELLQRHSQVCFLMNFHLIGVNHNSAPVEVRERLALPESRLAEACRRLREHPGVEEGFVLSTCNRVELLTNTKNGSVDLRSFIGQYFELNAADFDPYLYEYREQDAVRHLFRVTSSLDSMVVGEPQILGQVKEAYAVARAVGSVHSHLDSLLTRAFAVAKRVRT